jgi:hypothetical protein
VLESGKLGGDTAAEYGKLSDGDQGQIREFYLASLEQVDVPLRDKYFKLYAYTTERAEYSRAQIYLLTLGESHGEGKI